MIEGKILVGAAALSKKGLTLNTLALACCSGCSGVLRLFQRRGSTTRDENGLALLQNHREESLTELLFFKVKNECL